MDREITEKEYDFYKNYLQSYDPNKWPDYRFQPGFRLKKVMYAYRRMNQQAQTSIWVTFNKHDFNCNDRNTPEAVQKSNYVKVSPVVLPVIDFVGQVIIRNIINSCKENPQNQIYGIFYFAIKKPLLIWTPNLFHGKLCVYIREMFPHPHSVSMITAVFPYYNHRKPEYKVYLLFNHTRNKNYFQTRLTELEKPEGMDEMSPRYALINMSIQCRLLGNPPFGHRFAAIYVDRFTTLTVIFENNKTNYPYNPYKRTGFPKRMCHERVLIQHGGVVGLENYQLSYQFMDDPDGMVYHTLAELAQTNKVNPVDNVDMSNVVHPLIVLGSPLDTTNQPNVQAPFPGYGLRVQNTVPVPLRTATLLLPSGARFILVRDFYPDHQYIDSNGVQRTSQGLRYVTALWNNNTYKESTGPYADAEEEINGQTRSAFTGIHNLDDLALYQCLAP